jgi:DNA-binding NarL/FixJ family response regulator
MQLGTPKALRVLIADDAAPVREALAWALEADGRFAVVGNAAEGQAAIDLSADLKPDLLLLDIELPGVDGFTVARRVKAMAPPPAVVFLAIHSDPESRRQGMLAGADGFAAKGAGWDELLSQVRTAIEKVRA